MEVSPTTVLLPTTEWTTACEEVANQFGRADDLLVVRDHDSDPDADRNGDLPYASDSFSPAIPRCSGKTNAIAAGMRAARNDRIVWTDDDFHHPPDWLARLHAWYERRGPVTEVPFFVGRDPLALLLEPIYALGGTLGIYVNDVVWGGAVMFKRTNPDEAAFLRDLRRSVSDDGILTEHLDVTSLRRT